jgi:putative SOS response-associated peptidase YedK
MCGRVTLTASGEELAELFGLAEAPAVSPRYNIAPTQPVLAVRQAAAGRQAGLLRWGFSGEKSGLVINSRSEGVLQRPMFREAFRSGRCLVPADGFYEWKRQGRQSLPCHFHLPARRPFAIAGLWRPEAAGEACVLLTTRPHAAVEPVHDRMPVLLPPSAYADWLQAPPGEASRLLAWLVPWAGELEATPVGRAVNDARHDAPDCLEPERLLF